MEFTLSKISLSNELNTNTYDTWHTDLCRQHYDSLLNMMKSSFIGNNIAFVGNLITLSIVEFRRFFLSFLFDFYSSIHHRHIEKSNQIRIRLNVISKPSFTSTVGNVTSSDRIAPLTQVTKYTIWMKTQYRIARTHTYANRKHTARTITPRTANDNSSTSSSSSSSNNDKKIQMIHRDVLRRIFRRFFYFILFFFFCLVTNQTEEK